MEPSAVGKRQRATGVCSEELAGIGHKQPPIGRDDRRDHVGAVADPHRIGSEVIDRKGIRIGAVGVNCCIDQRHIAQRIDHKRRTGREGDACLVLHLEQCLAQDSNVTVDLQGGGVSDSERSTAQISVARHGAATVVHDDRFDGHGDKIRGHGNDRHLRAVIKSGRWTDVEGTIRSDGRIPRVNGRSAADRWCTSQFHESDAAAIQVRCDRIADAVAPLCIDSEAGAPERWAIFSAQVQSDVHRVVTGESGYVEVDVVLLEVPNGSCEGNHIRRGRRPHSGCLRLGHNIGNYAQYNHSGPGHSGSDDLPVSLVLVGSAIAHNQPSPRETKASRT